MNVGTDEAPIWVPVGPTGRKFLVRRHHAGFVALDADRWSIHIHSLGNRSARVALDNFDAGQKANGRWDSRHTITHLESVIRRT